MKPIYIILLLATTLMLSSCSGLLDKEPDFVTPENYFKNEGEAMNSLNGVYNRLIDTYGRTYSRGLFSYLVLNDESYFKNISINNIRVMTMDAADLDIGRFWEVLYEGVNRANLLLENIDRVDMDVERRNAIKGEALFLRGYYYYLLVDFFGDVPLKLTATKSPNDKYLTRASMKEVYAQIVKDMTQAEGLVLSAPQLKYNERVSKTAVQAVLARVFLKMAGEPLLDVARYEDAVVYADKVISSGIHALNPDFKQIFINHSKDINDFKECLWEVGIYGNNIGNIEQAGMVGIENGIECPDENIGYSGGGMRITAKLYSLFGTKDTLRRDWSISPYRYIVTNGATVKQVYNGQQIYDRNPGKWRREYELGAKARSRNSTNFPIIRYSDVLLMKAEAENAIHGQPPTTAIDAVNQVRRRAFGKPVDVVNVNSDMPNNLDKVGFHQYIQDERMREFCFEGLRRHDLIRWGIYVPVMNTLGKSISTTAPAEHRYGGNAGLNTTERNVLFPIPNTEITVNKLMTQNTGW
ncbi:RagB/SusD family nutrient uptake outer membrane protein [Sphingobacterium tabacisoli]|uniref:RagB/SusD family nutrient uptake outer membrane protein n=1 Tax=Sphingobacterium tabacisoli TaxID=2044855 RepID=A0ABW5L9C7_9SPHI|nr:RagB/SusD family nutrient uptake outer membrane protein [Sphingobacterium tabacisoli]